MSTDSVDRLVSALGWQPEDMDRARRAHRRTMLMLLILCLAMVGWTVAEGVNNILEGCERVIGISPSA